jgi:hypothetical protein
MSCPHWRHRNVFVSIYTFFPMFSCPFCVCVCVCAGIGVLLHMDSNGSYVDPMDPPEAQKSYKPTHTNSICPFFSFLFISFPTCIFESFHHAYYSILLRCCVGSLHWQRAWKSSTCCVDAWVMFHYLLFILFIMIDTRDIRMQVSVSACF